MLAEIEGYGYGKDNNGQSTGKPAKYQQDHLCDAFRYAVMTIIQDYGESRFGDQYSSSELDDEEYFYNTY